MADTPSLHFGGTSFPERHLRDILAARVHAVPPGGEIVWTTYYFRDRELAKALVKAAERGVQVHILMEAEPRYAGANDDVIAILKSNMHLPGLKLNLWDSVLSKKLAAHLHSKIYWFSHPVPTAFVGSFNPSTDIPEDEAIIAAIGDQDRGHNLLLETQDDAICAGLRTYSLNGFSPLQRFHRAQNGAIHGDALSLWFFPRINSRVVPDRLKQVGSNARISLAMSHFKDVEILDRLEDVVRRGGEARMIVHHTERRVPEAIVAQARKVGINIRRYRHKDALPMHSKYLLIETANRKESWLGSLNYNWRSRYINHEILLRSTEPDIQAVLARNFDTIFNECTNPE